MERRGQGSQGPPLSIRFVSGRAKDGATQSVVRSHAMAAFRSRQRHRKQLETGRNPRAPNMNMASIINSPVAFCRCRSLNRPCIASSSQSLEREPPSNPLVDGRELCAQCGRPQLLRMSHSQQLAVLQQQYPTITTFAAADFDPFGSMVELPQHLTSNYSEEMKAIKAHGQYKIFLAQ
jgi:hypothetical protein